MSVSNVGRRGIRGGPNTNDTKAQSTKDNNTIRIIVIYKWEGWYGANVR